MVAGPVRSNSGASVQPDADSGKSSRPTRESICAVVVTYNRWSCLEQCLGALTRQTVPLAEIFVIDNASTDGTSECLRKDFPQVTHVRFDENVGSSGGFFEGIRIAYSQGYSWIWVMDDDAIPDQTALQALVQTEGFRRPDTGTLACFVVGSDGRVDMRSRARQFDMRSFRTLRAVSGPENAQEAVEINAATFVGLLISRAAIETVGYPQKDFFITWDDIEYVYRISTAGFRSYLVSTSRITHLNTGTGGEVKMRFLPSYTRLPISAIWKSYYGWRNRMYLVKQYSTRWTFVREACKLAGAIILYDDCKFRRMQVLGQAIRDALSDRLGKRPFPSQPIATAPLPSGHEE